MWIITPNGGINTAMFDGYEVTPSEGTLTLSGIVYGDYTKRYGILSGSLPDLMNLMVEIITLKEHLDYSAIVGLDGYRLYPIKVSKDVLRSYSPTPDGREELVSHKSMDEKLFTTQFGSFFDKEHFSWAS